MVLISFDREFTLAAILGVQGYYEAGEAGLLEVSNKELARMQQEGTGQKWSEQDWDMAEEEHKMTFSMFMPNYFRYSFVVLIYLVLESNLKKMCGIARRRAPSGRLPDLRHDLLRSCKRYLAETVGFSSRRWEHLEDLGRIRNCIVHTSGKVEGKHAGRIRHLASAKAGIVVSDGTAEDSLDVLPLYLEGDMIMIQRRYCRWITQMVYGFFEELCDALSLPKMQIGD